jgi:chemotaxis protein methyltransferase CheR
MAELVRNGCFTVNLLTEDFMRLGSFIHSNFGIKMPENKKVMVESRLRKRLRKLNMTSYRDYCEYLFSKQGMEKELVNLIDVITTNKTDFFREPDHFHFLHHSILPEMVNGRYKRLSIWSAACSTGEEPYSLAMAMGEFARSYPDRRFDYSIIATDISAEVINKAKTAVYHEKRIESMPVELKKNYLLRSKDTSKKLVRIIPELRNKVTFRLLNLMDDDFKLDGKMDIIFCRNVIIYFDRETQKDLLDRVCRHLKIGGYLFMGHSEVLTGLDLPMESIAPTVYRKME